MKPKKKTRVIRNFDDLVEESKMCPTDDDYVFNLDPLEQHFFDVADKHGIIDEMFSERVFEEDYYGYGDELSDY